MNAEKTSVSNMVNDVYEAVLDVDLGMPKEDRESWTVLISQTMNCRCEDVPTKVCDKCPSIDSCENVKLIKEYYKKYGRKE